MTQERDLDEFLNTAQLAGTEFTAGPLNVIYQLFVIYHNEIFVILERHNIKIVQSPGSSASTAHNPFLLTEHEEKQALQRHRENKSRLRVPRRPPWKNGVSLQELERHERDTFLEWRRGLAQ